MSKEILEKEGVAEPEKEVQKPATEDNIEKLKGEELRVDGRHLIRYQYALSQKGKAGKVIKEEYHEEIRPGVWQKVPGEVTIEETLTGPHGEEHRMVSCWKPTPDGKDMHRYLRMEEKRNGKWEILEGTEQDMGGKAE